MKNFKKFTCFDTETESLNLRFSRPWQVSWIVFDHANNFYNVQDRYLDWPDLKVSEDAKRITHFDIDLYNRKKEDPKVVLADFRNDVDRDDMGIVFQNGLGFDTYMVANWKRGCGETEDWAYLERCVDTNAINKAQKLGVEVDKTNFLAWQFKLIGERAKVKTSVTAMCKELGIELDESKLHSSIYDVEKTIDIFQKVKFSVW
jgi:DNA polymerase III epsilon subunit-like protein